MSIENSLIDLRERIDKLENQNLNMRLIAIQLAISAGWKDSEILNVIGSSIDELKFLREK